MILDIEKLRQQTPSPEVWDDAKEEDAMRLAWHSAERDDLLHEAMEELRVLMRTHVHCTCAGCDERRALLARYAALYPERG